VLTATISYTNIAAVGTATGYSAIAYLMNAHELEFLVIRGSFTLGCFLFLSSLIARTWLQFGEYTYSYNLSASQQHDVEHVA
jgi:hypothetical protein